MKMVDWVPVLVENRMVRDTQNGNGRPDPAFMARLFVRIIVACWKVYISAL